MIGRGPAMSEQDRLDAWLEEASTRRQTRPFFILGSTMGWDHPSIIERYTYGSEPTGAAIRKTATLADVVRWMCVSGDPWPQMRPTPGERYEEAEDAEGVPVRTFPTTLTLRMYPKFSLDPTIFSFASAGYNEPIPPRRPSVAEIVLDSLPPVPTATRARKTR